MKKILAIIMIFLMSIPFYTTFAAPDDNVEERIVYIRNFEDEITNAVPGDLSFVGKNAHVVERVSGKDKALYMELKDGIASVDVTLDSSLSAMGVSFDLKRSGQCDNYSLSLYNSSGEMELLKVDSTGTYLYNGYRVDGAQAQIYQNVQILYDGEKKTYDLYVNGTGRIIDWAVTSGALSDISGFKLTFTSDTEDSTPEDVPAVWLDTICVYEGTDYISPSAMPKSSYNSDMVEFLPEMDIEIEPELYVSADFENGQDGIAFSPKDNICMVYEDQLTNNKYVQMERSGSSDVYFDITASPSGVKSVLEMDIKYEKNCYSGSLSIRSRSGAGTDIFRISGGTITSSAEGVVLGRFNNVDWTRIAVVYNLTASTFDFYQDGELTAENVAATRTIEDISYFRIYGVAGGGSADLQVDNIMVYDGSEPDPNMREKASQAATAVTRYDSTVYSWIRNALVFSEYSESIFYQGKKQPFELPTYQKDGQLMIPAELCSTAFGAEIAYDEDSGMISIGSATHLKLGETSGERAGSALAVKNAPEIRDGHLYLGVEDIFSTVYGKTVLYDDHGLTIVSSDGTEYTEDQITKISNYMIYDHPTPEQLNDAFTKQAAAHPRILASRETFMEVKENWQENEYRKVWGEKVISSADVLCNNSSDIVEFNLITDGNQTRLLTECRKAYSNARILGMAYWLTDDRRYIDRLWLDIQAAAGFPNWNPQHPLDVSEMSMAFAIAYDWCYDAWTDEQKAIMEEAMFQHGILPYREAQYGGQMAWTIVEKNNRGIVNNAGAATAAMAVYEKDPDLCAELISNAMWGMDNPMECFYPVGEWWEGAGYWGYALDYFTDFMSSVVSCFGTDFNMLNAIGLDQTAKFAMYSMGAKSADNFHDAGSGSTTYADCVYWLSDNLNDPSTTNIMLAKASGLGSSQALLWYNTSITGTDFDVENDMFFEGEDQYFSMRSSWTDDSATILMGHAGQGEGGHNHLDTGTFVLDMLGERWASDIGSDDYGITGLDNKDTRYLYYRYSPQGHNCLVINPGVNDTFYDMNSFCYLERKEFKEKGGYVIYDMTPAQAGRASAAKRGFRLDDNRQSAVVRDELTLEQDNSDVYWFMQTLADVEILDDSTVMLTMGGKQVKLSFITDADEVSISYGAAEPLPGTSDFPEQSDNGALGYKRIAVKLKASGSMYIQAKFVPIGTPCENSPNVNIPLDDWTAPDGELEVLPQILDIQVGGETIPDFSTTTTDYEYFLEDISSIPEVTATVPEGTVLEKTTEGTSVSLVVRNENGDLYRQYKITFQTPPQYSDVNGMSRLPVYAIEASSEPEEQNRKENVSDNDLGTRWTSEGDEEYIILDLGMPKDIDAAGVATYSWGGERIYTYDIQVSNDKQNWTTVRENIQNQALDDSVEVVPFDRVNARYIRLLCHCNNVNAFNNILEFMALQSK